MFVQASHSANLARSELFSREESEYGGVSAVRLSSVVTLCAPDISVQPDDEEHRDTSQSFRELSKSPASVSRNR